MGRPGRCVRRGRDRPTSRWRTRVGRACPGAPAPRGRRLCRQRVARARPSTRPATRHAIEWPWIAPCYVRWSAYLRAHAVVARVVLDLGQAERFEQRRHVHAEAAAVALAQPVPAADRVVGGAAPGLDGAVGGRLLLVGGAERHPVAVRLRASRAGPRCSAAGSAARSCRPGTPARADRRTRRGTSGTRRCRVASSGPTGRFSCLSRTLSMLPFRAELSGRRASEPSRPFADVLDQLRWRDYFELGPDRAERQRRPVERVHAHAYATGRLVDVLDGRPAPDRVANGGARRVDQRFHVVRLGYRPRGPRAQTRPRRRRAPRGARSAAWSSAASRADRVGSYASPGDADRKRPGTSAGRATRGGTARHGAELSSPPRAV